MSDETLANMHCEYEHECKNYNPHPKNGYCLDDQCPMNDHDNYDLKEEDKEE